MSIGRCVLAALLAVFASALPRAASAVVLDWDAASWSAGSLTQAYDVDSSPGATGDDVTLSIGGTTGELANDAVTNLPTPQINANLEGGQGAGTVGLNVAIDLGKKDRSVSLTINFAPHYALGVENVSFTIFGIDQAAGGSNIYIDEVRSIVGVLVDGSTVVTPTITNVGSGVTFAGTGLSQTLTGRTNVPATGAGSEAGNATISFNTSGLRSITLVFGAGGSAAVNPEFQQISFSDITFSPVPEINPALTALCSCLCAMGLVWRHRASVRTRKN